MMKETTKREFAQLYSLAPGQIADGLSLIHWENMTDDDMYDLMIKLDSCCVFVTQMMIRSLSKH